MPKTGVLLTGFGGPDSLEAVGPFMCNLMGHEPSEELVERVCKRYLAIGGESPLREVAAAIARKLEGDLADRGAEMPVAIGMRYWDPYIADALKALKEVGCERVITMSLSPFESKVAHGAYREAIDAAAAELGGLEIVEAPLVSEFEEYAQFFATATAVALSDVEPNEGLIVAFTAHSLPVSDLVEDDPYVEGLRRVATEVAEFLGLGEGMDDAGAPVLPGLGAFGSAQPPRAWYLVYQSKGNRPGAWLGPDLDELIDAVAESPARGVVVVPIGFLTDHMETRYDLDIVAADRALAADLEFMRAAVPNDDDAVVRAMAEAIVRIAKQ